MQFNFGSGILWGSRYDIANNAPIRFATLQDVSVEFSTDVKTMHGQYAYAIDAANGKAKINVKAKQGGISAVQFNALYFGGSIAKGQTLVSADESLTTTITGTGTAAVASAVVANNSSFVADLGLRYASNQNQLALGTGTLASALGVGTYSVGSGTYYLSSTDGSLAAGSILADYSYSETTTGYTVTGTNPLMGYSPRFKVTLMQAYEGSQMFLTFFAAICPKLAFATKLDDYNMPDLDIEVYAGANNLVYEFSASV